MAGGLAENRQTGISAWVDQRLELMAGALSIVVLAALLVPVRWAPGVTFAVGSATNEGVLGSLVALATGSACCVALLRKFRLSLPVLLVLALLAGLATLQLADLMSDAGGSCPREPERYFEPDLAEEFQGSSTCFVHPSVNLIPLAWVSTLISAALLSAGCFWRGSLRVTGVLAFVLVALFLLAASALAGLQHLE